MPHLGLLHAAIALPVAADEELARLDRLRGGEGPGQPRGRSLHRDRACEHPEGENGTRVSRH